MKRTFFVLFIGSLLLARSTRAQETGSSLPGEVDCKAGFTPCQAADQMFNGARQPAFHFHVSAPGFVYLEADVWEGFGCNGPSAHVERELILSQGPTNVFLRFDPPPDEGTQLSIKWKAEACDQTECFDYTMGDHGKPVGCENLGGRNRPFLSPDEKGAAVTRPPHTSI